MAYAQYRKQTIDGVLTQSSHCAKERAGRTHGGQEGCPEIPIDYARQNVDSGWKGYDVVIDGASLVTTYRGTFNDQIQKGGVDGLVKTLQERNHTSAQPAKK